MDWFLYDNGLRHERVKENESFTYFVVFIPAKFSLMDIDD